MTNLRKICPHLIASITILCQLANNTNPAFAQTKDNSSESQSVKETSTVKESIESVDKLLSQRKYEDALSKLKPLVTELKFKKDVPHLIDAYERLSLTQRKLNQFLNAQRNLKFAIGIAKPKDDDFEGSASKARILFYLADIEDELGQYVNASSLAEKGIAAVRQIVIGGKLPYLETELLNNHAHNLITQGKLSQATEILEEALYMSDSLEEKPEEKLIASSPVSREKEFLKAKILVTKSILKEVQGKESESKALAKEAAGIFKKHVDEVLEESRYASYLFAHSLDNQELLDKAKAKDNLTKAALLEVQAIKAKPKAAIKLLEESLKIKSGFLENSSATVGNTKVKIAKLYLETGNPKKAALLASQGYKALSRAVVNSSPNIAQATATLAKSYLASGETRGVEQLLKHAWKLEAKRLGNDSPEVLSLMEALSELYLKQKSYKKAVRMGIPVTTQREKVFGKRSTKLVPTLLTTGTALAYLRSCKKAGVQLSRAKSILESAGQTKTNQYGQVLASIGINDTHNYKWKKAKVSLTKAINLYKSLYGENHPNTLAMRRLYRTMYNKRSTVPGLNKNILKAGPMKLRPPDNYGH